MDFKYIINKIFIFFFLIFLSSCYHFLQNDSCLSSDIKTIQINPFRDNSFFPSTTLVSKFTSELKNIFIKNTNLKLVKKNGDIIIEGEFFEYKEIPINIQIDGSKRTRFIIKFRLYFINNKKIDKNFEKDFKIQGEYPLNETIFSDTIQDQLIPKLIEELTSKIYNRICNNW